MGVTVKIDPIDRDIAIWFKEDLSPQARSRMFAEFAQEQIDDAKAMNRAALGGEAPYTVYVDGRRDAELRSVKPDGIIVAEFHLVTDALGWIQTQLRLHSPVLTGAYAMNHQLFADDVEVSNPNDPPIAREYVFLNTMLYARKIERGLSRQAPDGVYQVVAELAKARFSNVAKIRFSYRTAIGGNIIGGKAGDRSELRNPAVVVSLF